MKEKSYRRNKNAARDEKPVDVWRRMMQEDTILTNYIEKNYDFDRTRMGVLQNILIGMGAGRKEEIKHEIYVYGSLIHGQDLMARQIFIWLLGMIEEMERTETE